MAELPMADPLAYFMTWPTYGTWLPGDRRGWVEYHRGWQLPDPIRVLEAKARMTEHACRLSRTQRAIVEATIRRHCELRGWILHEVNCRSNHLHLVVSAPVNPKTVRSQLKAYCTRMLRQDQAERSRRSAREQLRKNWWAERGSIRYLNDEDSLEAAILYVRHGQDRPRPPH